MKAITAIVLAGDRGEAMVSKKQRVMHNICGRPILEWVLDSVTGNISNKPVIVVNSDGQSIRDYFGDACDYALQRSDWESEGIVAAMDEIKWESGYVLIIAGNLPMISPETVATLVEAAQGNAASRLICFSDETESHICPAYCFDIALLRKHMKLTVAGAIDYLKSIRIAGLPVIDVYAPLIEGTLIEDRQDLRYCTALMQSSINNAHMKAGVTFIDPLCAYIDANVKIGMDTVIYPDVYLSGDTVIGEDCIIYNGCRFENTVVGDGCVMQSVVAIDAKVDDGAKVGPFVRLRPNTHIGAGCKIGNFVEVKNSTIGEKTSVAHLTYVGDADVGSRVNMGCGTVFVNYDGFNKHRSTVGNNVFLGCQTALVSPVHVGDDAYTAAGTVITEDVPEGSLAIGRSHQENKEGWVSKYRAMKKK